MRGQSNKNYSARFLSGIEIYNSGKANKLIFTGGINPLLTEQMPQGEKYIEEAISLGIPTENLFTTYPVVNTYEEAKAVRTLLSKELTSKTKKIILVTSAFHMKRARKLFEREGIKVQPYTVDFNRKSFRTILNNP